ncbi:iron-sulfur cluster-binding domain-containing protein [Psychrobacter sp. APC 3279]|uniref:flavin reductase family protein n=1 Tax=Psychrobacter sp. APC 3279 TaxID=3035189 RepID=UPI0025B4B2AA|nr:iron-sulfur cluster-binding domain-containing protein [Psychrobacter sp. APC 3279]MDN3440508.1 iron-sulfur cluster-binding domain-containing protein [Psychrobacter sp. APC 3279]
MANGYRPEIIQRAFVDFIGARLHPFWSLTTPKLRLIARYTLSDDLIALRFETNRTFKQQTSEMMGGWQGGQYLDLRVCIERVYHQRSYSIVGLAHQPLWWLDDNTESHKANQRHTVTIAIKPQGLVSDYLTKQMPLASVVDTSLPLGQFTLEQTSIAAQNTSNDNKPTPLLFIAGGSGITPMLGLINQALSNGHQVTLLHYSRTVSSKLQHQWQQLSDAYPDFIYHLIHTEDPTTYLAGERYLSAEGLLSLNLPLVDTKIFACGSQALLAGLYKTVNEISVLQNIQLRDNIIVENFGNALTDFDGDGNQLLDNALQTESHTVYLRSRQRQFDSDTTLLVAAENAGIRLAYGCRQGICQLCRCNKVSGMVKNIQTGKVSGDGYESIQTCINIAMTDLVLDV